MFIINDTGYTMVRTACKVSVKGGMRRVAKGTLTARGKCTVRTQFEYIVMFWMDLAEGRDRDRYRALVNAAMNLRVP